MIGISYVGLKRNDDNLKPRKAGEKLQVQISDHSMDKIGQGYPKHDAKVCVTVEDNSILERYSL